MTKKIIRARVDEPCWVHSFDGKTVEEAIAFLQCLDPALEMELDYGYEGIDRGDLYSVREETDEEYAERLAKEAEEIRKQEEADKLAEQQLLQRLMLEASKDLAFKTYMEKHNGNHHIGDLSNLFIAVMQCLKSGADKRAVQPMLDVMERLEKEGGTA